MKRFTLFAAFVALLFTSHARGAVLSPLFQPIRTAIVTNISALTNTSEPSPQRARQLRFLRLAQRNINRGGVPSLLTDIQILSSVTALLGRAFPEGQFNPVLETATLGYHDALVDFALNLSSNATVLPPSGATAAVSNMIADALGTLATFDSSAGLFEQMTILNRAASRLRTAQQLLTRPRTGVVRSERFTARVDGRSFQAGAGGTSANYNSTAQFLIVNGRDLSGVSGTRTITLYIADVTAGTTTHSLGAAASGTYAVYSTVTSTNSASFTSTSGTATVTLDATAGTVSGRFSFNADDASSFGNTARVTSGDFFLKL